MNVESSLAGQEGWSHGDVVVNRGGRMRRSGRQIAGAVLGITVLLGWSGQVRAAEGATCPICAKVGNASASYQAKAGCTLVRGTANTLLGWTELIRQPVDEAKAGGNVLVGIGKGIGQGVTRTLAGVGEVLTFWTPKIHNSYIHFANDCPVCMKKKTQ